MADEFDLLVDPPFRAYALPPNAFPGFSPGSYGGSASDPGGIAYVEYLYRPDYQIQGRMLGVANTRPENGNELLREDPLWWASPRVRVGEIITGDFPVYAGLVAGVGARYVGEATADVDGSPSQLQRWTTLPAHGLEESLSVIRVRMRESWVTLSSTSYPLEELEALVPRLKCVDGALVERLRRALADWITKFEERQGT